MKNLFLMSVMLFLISIPFVSGQSKAVNREKYGINIARTDERINLDGLLDEEVWKTAEKTGKFHRVTPTDTGYAIAQTEVMVTYDETNFYIGAVCYDPTPGKRPIASLKRDFSFMSNDNFGVFIDPYNDQTNGFLFYVSAAGVQYEALISNGSRANSSWDIKWRCSVNSYEDKWVIECAIPFRSLKYFEGDTEWGINFGRLDLKTNEKSVWAAVPQQFTHSNLAFTGTLNWDKPLGKSGTSFSLIPYVTGRVTKTNNGIVEENAKWGNNAGFDAKVMLSTSLNLDVTVNPDYSQVEEDRQVTNLDRFEISFPERRQFFLENSDLFAALGNSSARPFFSRRVGLSVPVYGGMRLSGNMGDKWRIGLMDIQTGEKDDIPATNFAVAALQRQVFSRSNITGFFINKEVTGDYTDSLYNGYQFNRVAGIEYNLASADNRWNGKAFYHQSFYPGAAADAAAVAGDISFETRYFSASLASSWIGSDFISEAGYIRRNGYFQVNPSLGYAFYPSSSRVLSHGPDLRLSLYTDPEFNLTDRNTSFSYNISFQDRSSISFSVDEDFVLLNRDYDPTNSGGLKLSAGESFDWVASDFSFRSDSRKLFTYSLGGGYGGYYNGTRLNVNSTIGYRFQPYGSISVSGNYNNISLPYPYKSTALVLLSPRLDITFTDKVFLTTLIQYNNQTENLNMNIRFQWRFAPVSDLFIVYTSNSYTEDFFNKNRGLAVKLSYWFN